MHGLDVRSIRSHLHSAATAVVEEIELFEQLDSTNEYLLEKCRRVPSASSLACLTEEQTAGRGRRGRIWVSPPLANLYLSLSWRLRRDLAEVTAVTMLLAFAVADALTAIGVPELEIKWPNDLLCRNRKLAGMLVEVCGSPGNWNIVIGIGLNVDMPSQASTAIGQAWIDLKTVLSECPDRNQLAGRNIVCGGSSGHPASSGALAAVGRISRPDR
jgi:BirA family biotin operon repressor/biotin-[acetyl-CoA-carboxylase] ligase